MYPCVLSMVQYLYQYQRPSTGILGCQAGQIFIGEVVINTKLVRIELVTSVDRQHGTRINHIEPKPITHSVTQVGHTARPVIVEKIMNITGTVVVCVNNDTKGTLPIFSSAG
jgi:hypothetical protein